MGFMVTLSICGPAPKTLPCVVLLKERVVEGEFVTKVKVWFTHLPSVGAVAGPLWVNGKVWAGDEMTASRVAGVAPRT